MAYLGDMIDRHAMDMERPKPRKDKIKSSEPEAYTAEEVRKILTAREKEPLKWRALVHVLIDTGIRRGECCALKWECVNFKTGAITIAGNLCSPPQEGRILGHAEERQATHGIRRG